MAWTLRKRTVVKNAALTLRVFVFTLFGSIIWSSSARAAELFCLGEMPVQLARFKASETCRARFELEPKTHLCLSRQQWNGWLSHRESSRSCVDRQGRWKLYSPPQNHEGEPKELFWRFAPRSLLEFDGARAVVSGTRTLERFREALSAKLASVDPLGVLRSLLLAEQVPDSPMDLFFLLGFVHVFTASGLHLYVVIRLLDQFAFASALTFGLSARRALVASRVLAAAVGVLLWGLSGFRLGLARPWAVVSLRTVAELLGFRFTRFTPLGIAIGIDLGLEWLWGGDRSWGRLHYGLAVGGGLLAMELVQFWRPSGSALRRAWIGHGALAVGSWLLPAVVEATESGLLALATPVLSLLTIPLITLAIYPLAVLSVGMIALGAPDLAGSLLRAGGGILNPILSTLMRFCLEFPMLWVLPAWTLGAGVLAAVCVIAMPIQHRLKVGLVLGAATVLARVAFEEGRTQPEQVLRASHVQQLDVGQGDSAWVRVTLRRLQHGLIDVGPERALSDAEWIRVLARRETLKLDWVALTHLDEDHAGGLHKLKRLIPIECVASSREEIETDRGRALQESLAQSGIRLVPWEQGCFPFHASGPLRDGRARGRAKAKGNARMSAVVVPLLAGGFYFNAGDAEARQELRLARWASKLVQGWDGGPRIYKATHHGSRFSSDPETLALLNPTEAWISSGRGNTYGHPALQTLALLRARGIPIRRTDEVGVIGWSAR